MFGQYLCDGIRRQNSSFGTARRGVRHRLLAAAAALAGLAIAGPAHAEAGGQIVGLQGLVVPAFSVESDGSKYTELVGSVAAIQGTLLVEVHAGITGRVKSWEAWPKLSWGDDGKESFPESGHSESYGVPRPRQVNSGFAFAISRADYAALMVQACNDHANALRGQGLSNSLIFAQDRQVPISVWGILEFETSSIGSVEPAPIQHQDYQFLLTCKAKEPGLTVAHNDPERNKPEVEQATLTILEEGSLRGDCSVHLSGVIRSKDPNTHVKFRYHSDDGRKSDLKTLTTDHTATVMFSHEYPLSEGGLRSGKVRILGEFPDFASDWASYRVNCGSPAQGYASSDPLPPQLLLNVGTAKEKMYKGFICPAKVLLDGRIIAEDAMEGRAIHVAAQQGSLVEPQQQVNEQDFSVVQDQQYAVSFEPELKWSNVPIVGGNPPKQTMKFTFQVVRHHTVIAEAVKTQELSCRKPQTAGVAQGAVGGVSGGQKPAQAQQAQVGGLAVPQAFAIQAPKGTVRKGEIRLSGGKATQTYKLTFFRKSGGKTTQVSSAQLPKQMMGRNASFPLAALTGGRAWRLRVCPVGQGANACKTSDFGIPLIGVKQDKAAQQKPAAKVFIVPSATK